MTYISLLDVVIEQNIDITDDEEVEEETGESKEDTWSDSGGDQFLAEHTAVNQPAIVSTSVNIETNNLIVRGVVMQDAVRPIVPR